MKTDLELRHLRVLAAVVEAGTHTRAARALGVSQSTVSETLTSLERAVGTAVFRKGGRGLALTPAGEVLLDYATRMGALHTGLVDALASASSDVKATLVISAVESVSAYLLPSRLARLRERWPAVRAEVLPGSCAEIRERVAAGDSDLGLVLESEDGPATGDVLARPRLLIVASPEHPLASGVTTVDALRGSDFHMCDAAGNYHQALRQLFEAAGLPAPRMQAMGTIEGVKRGILAGSHALGVLPEHAVEAEQRDGVLAEVRVHPPLPAVLLRAVRGPDARPSPVVDELVEALRAPA